MTTQYEKVPLRKYGNEYDSSKGKVNFLIYGKSGVGKTVMLETVPGRIMLHNFDPGGPVSLSAAFKEQHSIFDFSADDLSNPTSYRKWEKVITEMAKDKVFDNIDFLVIDSITLMSAMCMAAIVKKMDTDKGGKVKDPRQYYGMFFEYMQTVFIKLSGLPCNLIVLGHMQENTDEAGKLLGREINLLGKSKIFLPCIFEEFYYMDIKSKGFTEKVNGKDVTVSRDIRYFLTQKGAYYDCRTKIGRGIFDKEEVADISYLLKKAGYTKFLSNEVPK